MKRCKLHGSKLNYASYEESSHELTIEFYDKSFRRFKGVPYEVYVRLSQAPNAQAYFEDRIAEEYPNERARSTAVPDVRSKLDDLFG